MLKFMKLNKLVMVALVALGAVACEKSDKGIDDQSPKSVTINLANVQAGSRSMGDPLEETDKVVLERFQVFFTDGTTLYLGKKADGKEADHYFATAQGNLNPETFHFLPANVNQVIVVGNMDKIDVINGETKVEVLEKELAIEIQQEEQIGALSLYGEKVLTKSQDTDKEGHALYTANVEVAPRIARIEIANFTCNFAETEADREYKAFTINHVALNNYYTKTILSTAEVQEDDLENTVINSGSVEPFFEGLEDGWNNDKFAAPLELTWDANTKAVGAVDEVLAYNFFPGAKPQIVVRMTGTKNEENAQPAPTFLATLNLKDGNTPIAEFVAGTIYKIDFVFNESDPDQTEKCIDVTVTPVNWSVVTVTPEF
jgi:hypothetical protein